MDKAVKISAELYRRLKRLADKDKCFISWLLNRAVSNYLISRKYNKE
jgi:predicted transcriptional regulator